MKITCDMYYQKEALRQLRQLEDGVLRDRVFGAMQKGAERVEMEARSRVTVETGALRQSIKKTNGDKKNLTISVVADYPNTGRTRKTKTRKQKAGSKEYYAMAVEYGTRHMQAQPFLMPAGEAKAKELGGDLETAMEDALHDTGSSV